MCAVRVLLWSVVVVVVVVFGGGDDSIIVVFLGVELFRICESSKRHVSGRCTCADTDAV